MKKAPVGIIGGSGLYDINGLKIKEETTVTTPFGKVETVFTAELEGAEIVFIPRFGKNHNTNPSNVNYRANIFAFKMLGCNSILAISAVGSLQQEIKPGHFVLVDQYFDLTKGNRKNTFFDEDIVVHVPFGAPTSIHLDQIINIELSDSAFLHKENIDYHSEGTYVCIEGPQFSTKAESNFYKNLGFHVIGMSNMPEAKLAREAQLHYSSLCVVTDYDCWKEGEESVTLDAITEILKRNNLKTNTVLKKIIPRIYEANLDSYKSIFQSISTREPVLSEKMEYIMKILNS